MGRRITGSGETETTGGTNNPTGNSVTASTENKPAEKSVGVSDVKAPKIVAVEVPKKEEAKEEKKGRGRPKGTTAAKKKKAAASKPAHVDHTHVKVLLMTVSGMIATRPNMLTFMLTAEEAEQIALPLSNILAKNEGVAALTNEYADHIALLVAAVTIIVPKFLLYRANNPKKERSIPHAPRNEERPIDPSHRENDRNLAPANDVQTNTSSFNGSINDFLAPVNGF